MFGTTERVDRMKKRYMDSIPRVDSQRAVLVTESYMKTEAEPMVLRRAKALKKIFEEIGVFIADDELIVGSQTDVYRGASLYPEYGIEWLYDELDTGVFDARTTSSEQILHGRKRPGGGEGHQGVLERQSTRTTTWRGRCRRGPGKP